MAESKEELKSLLMKLKQESEKAGLELNIQKTKLMAFSPIASWQINGETMESVIDLLIFLVSKTTVDDDCSHEIKRHLLLWRKAMRNLDSILEIPKYKSSSYNSIPEKQTAQSKMDRRPKQTFLQKRHKDG